VGLCGERSLEAVPGCATRLTRHGGQALPVATTDHRKLGITGEAAEWDDLSALAHPSVSESAWAWKLGLM
jgi:hypothetical protein